IGGQRLLGHLDGGAKHCHLMRRCLYAALCEGGIGGQSLCKPSRGSTMKAGIIPVPRVCLAIVIRIVVGGLALIIRIVVGGLALSLTFPIGMQPCIRCCYTG